MSGNIPSTTPPWDNPAVREVNRALSERVKDVIDSMCGEMIAATFDLVQAKLKEDAKELKAYEDAGAQESAVLFTFVSSDLLEAPMVKDEPTPTLILRLQRKEDATTETSQLGDTLRLLLPVRGDHVYPDPLSDDDLPPEMYIESSDSKGRVKSQRYLIQPDENDLPKLRLAVFEYDSAYDKGEQEIYGSLSDRMIYRGTQSRAPINAELAMQLIVAITDYDVVPKPTTSDVPPEQQQTA